MPSSESAQLNQPTESRLVLDFGDRLTPGALQNLHDFFTKGWAKDCDDYLDCLSILALASEVRFVDAETSQPLPAFEDLITHLRGMKHRNSYNRIFYGLAWSMETQDTELWSHFQRLAKAEVTNGSNNESPQAAWFKKSYPDAYWILTWSMLSGEQIYPFETRKEKK